MQHMERIHRLTLATGLCIFLTHTLLWTSPAYSEFEGLYESFLGKGKAALQRKDYQRALFYFDSAYKADPTQEEPKKYIQLINQAITQKTDVDLSSIPELEVQPPPKASLYPPPSKLLKIKLRPVEVTPTPKKTPIPAETVLPEEIPPAREDRVPLPKPDVQPVPEQKKPAKALEPAVKKTPPKPVKKELEKFRDTIELDDELWSKQPNTIIEIPMRKYVILKGKDVKRYLVLEAGVIGIEEIKPDTFKIFPIQRNGTFLHIWDNRGRWTFHIKGIIPIRLPLGEGLPLAERVVEHEKPFRLAYSNNWDSYYQGRDMSDLSRQSLGFRQWWGIFGKIPYGEVHAALNTEMFDESTEIVGQTVGIRDGKIGPFRDFKIVGWDTSTRLSDLSLPGRYFRGGLLEAFAFNRRLKYTIFQGHDRASYITLSRGEQDIRKSWIEGAKVTLFPDEDDWISINYARGWGEERQAFLKDRVYSLEGQKKYEDLVIHVESAFDEDVLANTVHTNWERGEHKVKLYIRDIDKDFLTVTGTPSDQGEVGGQLFWRWQQNRGHIQTNLDIYRDREFPNPDNEDAFNIDSGISLYLPLNKTFRWNNTLYYSNTEQLISPRRSIRFGSSITKTIEIPKLRPFSTFLGFSFQRNRYSTSPQSDYDRYSMNTGIRMSLIDNLSVYGNFEYSIAEDISTGSKAYPTVFNSGLSYSHKFGSSFYSRYSLTYRNEENTDKPFSFLSGSDTFGGTWSLSYRPNVDMEIYMDLTGRNIWAEEAAEIARNEADLRFGVRAAWDTFFSWDPTAVIYGQVYKDLNENLRYDPEEPGIPGIAINIGRNKTISNENGEYRLRTRGKKVKVALDVDSIPSGYVFTNEFFYFIPIEHMESRRVDFGFKVLTSIVGIVFHDKNANGKVDQEESVIPRAVLILDNQKKIRTNHQGYYIFEDVVPGKHTVSLDLNSIPLEFVPFVKLKNEVILKEGERVTLNYPLRKRSKQ